MQRCRCRGGEKEGCRGEEVAGAEVQVQVQVQVQERFRGSGVEV